MDKWINIKDQLPPLCEYVIVAICDESGDTPYKYTTSGWMVSENIWIVDNDINHSVTHWKSFPLYPTDKSITPVHCQACASYHKCVNIIKTQPGTMVRCIRFGELREYIKSEEN